MATCRKDGNLASTESAMEIHLLTDDDLPAAMDLSAGAGWNQLEMDWSRLLSLSPGGCFGGWVNGELVATSTALNYEDGPCWIGMVLVSERHFGHGRHIFQRALVHARESGTSLIGLDATDMGRPLYRQATPFFALAAKPGKWVRS
jgi:hypothetical protein